MAVIHGLSGRRPRIVKRLAAALIGATLWAAQLPAQAQPAPIAEAAVAAAPRDGLHLLVSPQLVAQLVHAAGHRVREAVRDPAAPRLVVDVGGLVYGIDFHRCTVAPPASESRDGAGPAPHCAALRFETGFDLPGGLPAAAANDWNRDRRFGTVWLDADGDPHLAMDASLAGGVATAHVADLVDCWVLVLADFQQHLREMPPVARGAAQ